MKILCACSQGNKRSVFTRYVLNYSKHEALAIGVDINTTDTIILLCNWADVILLAEPQMKKKIPTRFQHKVDDRFTIGPDVFPTNITGRLKDLVKVSLKNLGYI